MDFVLGLLKLHENTIPYLFWLEDGLLPTMF